MFFHSLEPCVEEVVFFPEQNHSTMPYAIKQMIAHEVQMEIMRRKEGADHDDNKIENDAMKNSPAPNQVNIKKNTWRMSKNMFHR